MLSQPRMMDRGRRPRLVAPAGACDTHSHIYGPRERYPHVPDREPDHMAELDQYRAMLSRIGVERSVIVQPSLYGFDNRATLEAVAALGPERARGVAVCRSDVLDVELDDLHRQGIRGLRAFLLVDDVGLGDLPALARRAADRDWHLVVQGDGEWLGEAMPVLATLPCPVVIDHLGRTPASAGTGSPGFRSLLAFLETGRCWVKISAPYLSSDAGPPGYPDVADRVRALVSARPDRLLWAANWPHPNSPLEAKPDDADCLDPLLEWVPDEGTRASILAGNAAALYGF